MGVQEQRRSKKMGNDMVYNLSEVSKDAFYDNFPALSCEVDQNGLVDFQRDCLVQAINIVFPTSRDLDKLEIALAMIADPLAGIEKKPDIHSEGAFGVFWLANCQRFQNQVDIDEYCLVNQFVGYLYRKQACR
jgi:hypothetical protein